MSRFLWSTRGVCSSRPWPWYSHESRWDLAPGYRVDNPQFDRPIKPDCLFCHANQFEPVKGAENRYVAPTFRGHAIGCERCHGPGQLHASHPEEAGAEDLAIVNPAKLEPALRGDVCRQCHLLGSIRFARGGRDLLEYRPGLPLRRFLAVFLKTAGDAGNGEFRAVGHFEQMEASRCATASRGVLGCTSCHDPHRVPRPAERVAYYRNRCMACHADRGCSVPLSERTAQGRGDDCVACHMPRSNVTNIPHTAATNHAIPRRSDTSGITPQHPDPRAEPLIDVFAHEMSPDERADAQRDMGVALSTAGWFVRSSARSEATQLGQRAIPLLEPAVMRDPGDVPAREALGVARALSGQFDAALKAFEEVTQRVPGQESSLRSQALLLTDLNRPAEAARVWRQAIALDPWRSDYHAGLALTAYRSSDWASAVNACRSGLKRNPARTELRSLLVQALLRAGKPDEADAEFAHVLSLNRAGREVWIDWYSREKAAAAVAR
ncbi:MAG: tetratricopeptide repeat protein [Isosphaeraceae bacterium]